MTSSLAPGRLARVEGRELTGSRCPFDGGSFDRRRRKPELEGEAPNASLLAIQQDHGESLLLYLATRIQLFLHSGHPLSGAAVREGASS